MTIRYSTRKLTALPDEKIRSYCYNLKSYYRHKNISATKLLSMIYFVQNNTLYALILRRKSKQIIYTFFIKKGKCFELKTYKF